MKSVLEHHIDAIIDIMEQYIAGGKTDQNLYRNIVETIELLIEKSKDEE